MTDYENGQKHAHEQQAKLAAGAPFGIEIGEVVPPETAMEYVENANRHLQDEDEHSGINITRVSRDFWRGYLSAWD